MRSPTKGDAHRFVALHKKMYDIDGCLGSLDFTKFHKVTCPSGWKGQFEGKAGFPTILLEAVADYISHTFASNEKMLHE